MRIAHFCIGRCNPDGANGVDRTICHLSKSQAALGNQVAVFALTAKEPLPIPGVEVASCAPARSLSGLPKRLSALLEEWHPDVVHLHSIYTPANAALARWLRGQRIPYVVTPHSALLPSVSRRTWYLKIPYKLLVELPTLNGAAFVHAVSDANGLRGYGVRRPVVVAPNAIDLAALPSPRDPSLLCRRWPAARGKKVFMFVGRLDAAYKGVDLLLRGFALARLEGAVLVLVGPDHRGQRKSLKALVERLGIDARVSFLGPHYGRVKFDLLAGADVFALCSRSEGMPLAVLEAAACERPCMVSAAANPGGLIERYDAGLVVEPHPAVIAEGFARLAHMDASELKRMGVNARRMVEKEFDWIRTATVLVQAYADYAGAGRGQDRHP